MSNAFWLLLLKSHTFSVLFCSPLFTEKPTWGKAFYLSPVLVRAVGAVDVCLHACLCTCRAHSIYSRYMSVCNGRSQPSDSWPQPQGEGGVGCEMLNLSLCLVVWLCYECIMREIPCLSLGSWQRVLPTVRWLWDPVSVVCTLWFIGELDSAAGTVFALYSSLTKNQSVASIIKPGHIPVTSLRNI